MQVRLISVTAPLIQVDDQPLSPEGLIAYCARVSSPIRKLPIMKNFLPTVLHTSTGAFLKWWI